MRVGIDFAVKKEAGGAYQYCLTFLDALKGGFPGYEFVVFNSSPDFPVDEYNRYFKIVEAVAPEQSRQSLRYILKEWGYRLLLMSRLFAMIDVLFKFFYRSQLKMIKDQRLDLMIFPSGARYATYLDIPFVTVIYDLEHRKNPQFPELSKRGRYLSREYYFRGLCQKAALILVDSEIGRQDVIDFYQVNPEKIRILPYLPPDYLNAGLSAEEAARTLAAYDLPEKFLFYPAQFWPHKNHRGLAEAVNYLRQQGQIVNLVLSGSKRSEWGEYDRVFSFIKDKGLDKQIRHLGYIDNQTIAALYKKARALAMPTFLGPTNIPVLEAWQMGCPVLYSDIRGCGEQLGDAGLLFNPADYRDMAEKISILWQRDDVRDDLIAKGRTRLAMWTKEDFTKRVKEILDSFKK